METPKVYRGLPVTFNPSESKLEEFKKEKHKTYPAIVTGINDNSVDLTVYGVGEILFVFKIPHSSKVEADRSSWDLPIIES